MLEITWLWNVVIRNSRLLNEGKHLYVTIMVTGLINMDTNTNVDLTELDVSEICLQISLKILIFHSFLRKTTEDCIFHNKSVLHSDNYYKNHIMKMK